MLVKRRPINTPYIIAMTSHEPLKSTATPIVEQFIQATKQIFKLRITDFVRESTCYEGNPLIPVGVRNAANVFM